MSLTTGKVIKHSVKYLKHEVDIMFIVMNHWKKILQTGISKLQDQSKLQNSLILLFI